MAEKPVKPARKRATSSQRTKSKRNVEHDEIAKRAYFIYIQEGLHDELDNWLRAERELTTA